MTAIWTFVANYPARYDWRRFACAAFFVTGGERIVSTFVQNSCSGTFPPRSAPLHQNSTSRADRSLSIPAATRSISAASGRSNRSCHQTSVRSEDTLKSFSTSGSDVRCTPSKGSARGDARAWRSPALVEPARRLGPPPRGKPSLEALLSVAHLLLVILYAPGEDRRSIEEAVVASGARRRDRALISGGGHCCARSISASHARNRGSESPRKNRCSISGWQADRIARRVMSSSRTEISCSSWSS